MVKKLTLVEATMLSATLKRVIGVEHSPVKLALIETSKALDSVILEADKNREAIFEKYVIKNEEGVPELKEGVTQPQMLTDFKLKDEEALTDEINELGNRLVEVDFTQKSKSETVLVPVKDTNIEMSLEDYLEKSTSISPAVVALLNEYFLYA